MVIYDDYNEHGFLGFYLHEPTCAALLPYQLDQKQRSFDPPYTYSQWTGEEQIMEGKTKAEEKRTEGTYLSINAQKRKRETGK